MTFRYGVKGGAVLVSSVNFTGSLFELKIHFELYEAGVAFTAPLADFNYQFWLSTSDLPEVWNIYVFFNQKNYHHTKVMEFLFKMDVVRTKIGGRGCSFPFS